VSATEAEVAMDARAAGEAPAAMELRAATTRSAVDWPAIGAAGLSIVLWASAFVGIRAVAPDLAPGSLALGRATVGAIALGIVVALRRPARPSRRMLLPIVVSGILWMGLYNIVLNTGERHIDAGTAAMLVNTGPLLIALLGGLFLGEGFPPRLMAGLAVAFLGAIIIGLATAGGAPAENPTLGVALCLLAALLYALGVTLQKPVVAEVPALMVAWLGIVVGAMVCLPFVPDLARDLTTASPASITWIVYLGLFPTAIGFTTWAFALNRMTAGRLGATTYLVPAVAVVMAWLLLGESPTVLALVGGVIAIAGVAVARSRPRSSAPA
jgi:drug/metabolite transporter (DMT)-like permease